MAEWDYVEHGFNSADETINFGTRSFATGNNVYETSTLALLKNTVQGTSNKVPFIKALIENGCIFLASNSRMRAFSDLLCSDINFDAAFDNDIDTFFVTPNGRLLMLGLQNGDVYCIDLHSENNIVYTEKLMENENVGNRFFLDIFAYCDTPRISFYLILRNGQVYHITAEDLDDQTLRFSSKILFDTHCCASVSCFMYPLIVVSGEETCIYNLKRNELEYIDDVSNLKKIFLLNTRMLFALKQDGSLCYICTKTFLVYSVDLDVLFTDILLMSNAGESQIISITSKDEFGASKLQLLSYPDYSVIFSLNITDKAYLIAPEHIHDEVRYISEIKHADNNINEIRIQVVTETNPEYRLKRLLKRGKFDEAEQFANLFKLDLSEIKKAKVQAIVDKVVCDKSDIVNLVKLMNEIEDYEFKVESCLRVHGLCKTLNDVKEVLRYAHSLVMSWSDDDNSDNIEFLQDLVLQLIFLFDTFMTIQKCDENLKSTVQDWIDFSECNMFEELVNSLKDHCIEKSIIIYNRLNCTTVFRLNECDIEIVLNILDNIPLDKQISFLHVFIPLTLTDIPMMLGIFIKWIIEKVYQLERKYLKDFPENAIEFIKIVEPLLKKDINNGIDFQQQNAIDHKWLQQLSEVYQALERLKILKCEYRVVVSLQQFLQQKETLIETLLTQIIYCVDNENFLEDFIRKFTINAYCEPDLIFKDLIKDIVKYEEDYWIKIVPVILNSISSLNHKLEATILIVKLSKVPWCTTVREIAHASLQYSHPLVEEIVQYIEFEPKCVILKKEPYDINLQYMNEPGFLKFAVRRIIYCNQPTMINDVYQVCKNAVERHDANMLLAYNFIEKGEIESALSIINNNTNEESIYCCKSLATVATLIIEDKSIFNDLQENYYKIIEPIIQRLQQDGSEYHEQVHLEKLKNVYKIQKKFGIKVRCLDLGGRSGRDNILVKLISIIISDFQDSNEILNSIRNCENISIYLKMDQSEVLLKFCEYIGDFNALLGAANRIFENDCTCNNLCRIATLILFRITSLTEHFESRTNESGSNDGKLDLDASIKGLRLANKIITKAMLNANVDEIGVCMEVANWLQSTYCLSQDKRSVAITMLMDRYGIDLASASASNLNAVKYVFQFYKKAMGDGIEPNTRYLTYFNHDVPKLKQEEVISEIQFLQTTAKVLCTEGQSLTAYKLIRRLQLGLVCISNDNCNLQSSLNEILKQCLQQLLLNIFASRNINADFAYSLLLSWDVNDSQRFLVKCLKYYKRDLLKFKIISQIRLRFLQFHKIEEGQHLCKTIISLSKWWKTIKNCQLSYEQFFKDPTEKVAEKLIEFHHLNVASLQEFCADFNLNTQNYYEFYLKNLLLSWKPNYEILTNVSGRRQLIIKDGESNLMEECMEIISIINDNEYVSVIINNLWALVNFYYYEVFMCMLDILALLKPDADNNQKNLVLVFLKNYTRVSKPGQTEIEEWYTLYPNTQCVDALSEWRLPFSLTLFTNRIWNIIRPEINLKTYITWFKIVSVLKKNLTKDDICAYVIKDVISNDVFKKNLSGRWLLYPKHKDLLLKIDECLKYISNKEQATSAIYCLTTSIPGGADQVDAITLCYKYAQEYRKQCPQSEDVQRAVIKIKKKYLNYSTTHILHINELADKKYLDLVSNSIQELIEMLYMDDRILEKYTFATSHCPDINKTVDELATLYCLNIQEIRFNLMKKLLLSDTTTDFDLNNSVYFASPLENQNKYNLTYSSNILRASYVCTSGNISVWRSILVKLGTSEGAESRNLNFKTNALKCLHNISDVEVIQELLDLTTYEEFCNLINKFILLSGLEWFGFTLSVESLDKYNKTDLLSRLAYHLASPIAVKTMASVCIVYTMDEIQYWTTIINAMLKLDMMEELKASINFLKKLVKFHSKEFYINAWQAIITNSFNVPSNTNKDSIKSIFIKNLHFIQSCPVLFSLSFENVVKKCIELEMYSFAALLVQFLPIDKCHLYLKETYRQDNKICAELDEMSKHGIWGISFVKNQLAELVKQG